METDLRGDTPGVHRLLTSLVAPRPIGWISTIDTSGVSNLAPYSYFNLVHTDPPVVMFSAEDGDDGLKHTPANAIETGEFVINLVTEALAEAMEHTAHPASAAESEFKSAGLEEAPSVVVDAPRVAASAAHLECELRDTKKIHGSTLIFGDVRHVHVDEDLLTDEAIDARKVDAVGRLGGPYFTGINQLSLTRRTDY
ncbi:flavin reductase family protein [Halobacterium sp. KA-6]|jgi:flavin reductase (DIM6/NTAB) family NADH-FMN oxidoreductase RutF|uniref:flavin reductase family protein n=1 Tax=Halobacterium sp. KA-6 TaxID=2896368 RepID=UPI001E3E92B7|nr:flavin reductase family protein [Halobacterium sp. KA-6]MCD2203379.1 flavin reductase family protein [Halobacterium sp. KA-6]